MLGDCKIQTMLDEVKPNEEDRSYVAVVEDQTCWINLVAFFLISSTYQINLLVYNYP